MKAQFAIAMGKPRFILLGGTIAVANDDISREITGLSRINSFATTQDVIMV